MTRILLVDDHALFRESLARWFESQPDFLVVGQCSTVDEANQALAAGGFDIVLLDFELGDHRGSEVVLASRAKPFNGKILFVTVGMTRAEMRQALNHGASGVFLKNNGPELLVEAIREVMAGGTWIDPKYVSPDTDNPHAETNRRVKFTERDRIVLRGVFDGLANKEIAEQLRVSESAIKASLQQLFSKTGVRTRSQLVRAALENFRRELV
ncbi:MAG TPA: response regulator transcription factor [Bryobacteraceae bacterium]|nr:response regulator transcription factor [Bryobacteraceae bacterium]